MKKNVLKKGVALLLAGISCVGVGACGKKQVPDTEETLQIWVSDSGYSTKWLTSMVKVFEEQSWVKEKYPNLIVDVAPSTTAGGSGYTDVIGGPAVCSYDLIATLQYGNNYFDTTDSNGKFYFEELSSLYEDKVPGEDLTLKEKMRPELYAMQEVEGKDGSLKYYAVPYLDSTMGLLYNEAVMIRAFGADYDMPNTTEEFVQVCQALVDKGEVPIIGTSSINYWLQMFIIWWAQYEGIDEYKNFWYGIKDGEYNGEVTKQLGRKYSLLVCDSLLNAGNGFLHPENTTRDFMYMQRYFETGRGTFQCNGDWFTSEMNSKAEDIRYMRTPVISYIVEQCTSIKTDAQLSAVVDYVDANDTFAQAATKYSEAGHGTLTEADYNKIFEARNAVFSRQGSHFAIPSYAKGKEVAKDFIRFCATDIAIEAMMDGTDGFISPYNFTPKEGKLANYAPLWRDRFERLSTTRYIPNWTMFRLNYYGGLIPLKMSTNSIDNSFMADNKADRKNPIAMYESDWKYYLDNNESCWKMVLSRAGL